MQRWEYLRVSLWYEGGKVDSVHSNGVAVYDRRKSSTVFSVSEYFRKLGAEGWEMVGSMEWGASGEVLHFKRPME